MHSLASGCLGGGESLFLIQELQSGEQGFARGLMEIGRLVSFLLYAIFVCADTLDRDVFTMFKGKGNLVQNTGYCT